MHLTRFVPILLVITAFSFIGCNSTPRSQTSINFSKVYVEVPQSSDSSIVSSFNTSVVETAEGELRSRGYVITNNKADADATLRSTWHISNNINSARKDEVSLSLSMSLFTKQGKKVFSSDSGSAVPASFWNVAKTVTTVDNVLARLPVVTAPAK